MRVLHVHSGNLYGGVETVLETLAVHGPASGMTPEFAVCFAGRLSDRLRTTGRTVHLLGPVRLSRPWQVRRVRAALAEVIRGGVFDAAVAHSPWTLAVFGPVLRRLGVPLAFWAHDAVDGRHWLQRLGARAEPGLVLCNSRYTSGGAVRMFPAVPRRVLYPPLHVVAPAPDARARIRAAGQTPPGAVVVAQVGRMERWKGHEVLLDALARLDAVPAWECWIVGGAQRAAEETYVEALRLRAARSGIGDRVRFLGHRTDVPDVLAAADVFVQANLRPEPFGLVYVEALAAGLPAVASALGGALEIVDESCGVLVPPGDAAALAAALRALLGDETRRAGLGAGGRERAQRLCDPARQLAALEDALRDLQP